MADDQGITLGIILQHMQGMERRLSNDIKKVRTDLTARIDRLESKLEVQIEQETAYLFSSKKNRKHLEKSLQEARKRKTVRLSFS